MAERLAAGRWQELDDAFWTTIPFGTGGRRGKMYPVGTNAINDRTIGESAAGLADYVKDQVRGKPLSCAIAYDTRHRSRQFAELRAEIMAAAGFRVFFLDGYRSTPELSFAVRYKQCDCGIIITASHNPPADNAVKVYWSTGGQLLPPHDEECIARVEKVTWIRRKPFQEGLRSGQIVYCQEEVDAAFVRAVLKQSVPGPRNLKVLYSPLHGVGCSAVIPVLAAAGFAAVEVFGPHAAPDGDFPNVPKHVANPENAAVFDAMIAQGRQSGIDLILATDPDCDRLGCAAPVSAAAGAAWATLTGNQIGALLTDYLLSARQAAGTLRPRNYIVKTLRDHGADAPHRRQLRRADGRQPAGRLQVHRRRDGPPRAGGFRLRRRGILRLPGRRPRPRQGRRGGGHAAVRVGGAAEGRRANARGSARRPVSPARLPRREPAFRADARRAGDGRHEGPHGRPAQPPPAALAGMNVVQVRDYLAGTVTAPGGRCRNRWRDPTGDLIFFDLEPAGNYVAIRPSGTEPKVKFYMFAFDPPAAGSDLAVTKAAQAQRLRAMEADLRALAGV